MTRDEQATVRAVEKALGAPGHTCIGRSAGTEVIAIALTHNLGLQIVSVALEVDMPIGRECAYLDALAANDPAPETMFDEWGQP